MLFFVSAGVMVDVSFASRYSLCFKSGYSDAA
jgi:hypothetical protein